MLGGSAPILIIKLAKKKDSKNAFGQIIPFYLSEEKTGIYVDRDNYNMQIATDTVGDIRDNQIQILQKGLTQTQEVDLVAARDSVGLNILLPLFQTIYSKLLHGTEYDIAYFHQNCLIYSAKLAQYTVEQRRENELLNIHLSLEVKPPENKSNTAHLDYQNGNVTDHLPGKGAA